MNGPHCVIAIDMQANVDEWERLPFTRRLRAVRQSWWNQARPENLLRVGSLRVRCAGSGADG